MYKVTGSCASGWPGSWPSVRPNTRPRSTAFSWASRLLCSVAVKSRSSRAWNRPARAAAAQGLGQRLPGPLARLIEQVIEHVDIGLLLSDGVRGTRGDGIGVAKRHIR